MDPRGRRAVTFRAGAVAFASALLPVVAWLPMRPDPRWVALYLAATAGVVAVASGAMWFESWRVGSRLSDKCAATAWIILGVVLLADAGLASRTGGMAPTASGLDQLAAVAMAAWVVRRTSTSSERDSARDSTGAFIGTVAAGIGLMVALHLLEAFVVPWTWEAAPAWRAVSDVVAGLGWLALAVSSARSIRRLGLRLSGTPAALALVGVAVLVRAPTPTDAPLQLVSSAVLVLAASVALGATVARLREGLFSEDRHERSPRRTPGRSQHQALVDQERLEEWLHDVRNSVSGLRAADALLRERTDRHPEQRAELAEAVSAELTRLHHLVEPDRSSDVQDVELREVVEGAVAVERLLGLRVHVAVGAFRVRAEPLGVERAVRNVLANARLHARGSPVYVEASEHGGVVSLLVWDDGPGIPFDEVVSVFGRGRRGRRATGAGSGLGLYVARELLLSMGGDVRIVPGTAKGCCVEFSLPTASHAEPVSSAT